MTQKLLFLFMLVLLMGCTTSKWTVVDEYAVDESEKPRMVSEDERLLIDEYPTIENPIIRLAPFRIVENEYSERILVERAVQQYRPRWGFALLALSGSAFAITAANTDMILTDPSRIQSVGLTAAGLLLGSLAFTNLRESGDSILTDEKRYLRSTGKTIKVDTVRTLLNPGEEKTASIEVDYNGSKIFEDHSVFLSGNSIDLNVGAFASQLDGEFTRGAEIAVKATYNQSENRFSIPVNSFLESYFIIQNSVAQVRSNPSISSGNVLVELGENSELLKLDDESSDWIKVEYAGQEAYISRESGVTEWRSRSEAQSALLVELTDIPFGEIDVENSLPILKSNNEADRAIIFSNFEDNQIGSRQLLSRSHQLFERYMRTSLQMKRGQVRTYTVPDATPWEEKIRQCGNMEGGSLNVFVTGFARVVQSGTESDIVMIHTDLDGEQTEVSLSTLFNVLGECGSDKLFIFVDLEYKTPEVGLLRQIRLRNGSGGVQKLVANKLVEDFPNSVVIFGNSTTQPSSEYRGGALENDKRHYIFSYYWAQALKQRKTTMSDLINHLENNVDYTSRRLHDSPQEVRAFGNVSLNIAR